MRPGNRVGSVRSPTGRAASLRGRPSGTGPWTSRRVEAWHACRAFTTSSSRDRFPVVASSWPRPAMTTPPRRCAHGPGTPALWSSTASRARGHSTRPPAPGAADRRAHRGAGLVGGPRTSPSDGPARRTSAAPMAALPRRSTLQQGATATPARPGTEDADPPHAVRGGGYVRDIRGSRRDAPLRMVPQRATPVARLPFRHRDPGWRLRRRQRNKPFAGRLAGRHDCQRQ